jgi:hypothetical protein
MEADQQDNSKVLNFRPRTLTGSRDRKDIAGRDENICRLVCTENLSSGVVVVKSAKDGV